MDDATRSRIVETFCTTWLPGKGTGPGLAVVHTVAASSCDGWSNTCRHDDVRQVDRVPRVFLIASRRLFVRGADPPVGVRASRRSIFGRRDV